MKRFATVAVVSLAMLNACEPTKRAPVSPREDLAENWESMATWFAERGVRIPEHPPQPISGKPNYVNGGIIGDIDGTGRVDFADVLLLFLWLSDGDVPVSWTGQNLADVDRSGVTDWEDLLHMGIWVFSKPRPVNQFRIGKPLIEEPAVEEEEIDDTFDIKLVFLDGNRLSVSQKSFARSAARRWERIIVADVPDYRGYIRQPFDTKGKWSDWWDRFWPSGSRGVNNRILIDRPIDDILIFVTTAPRLSGDTIGMGGYMTSRAPRDYGNPDKTFPILSGVIVAENILDDYEDSRTLKSLFVHEIGHALGLTGTMYEYLGLIGNPSSRSSRSNIDTHHRGYWTRNAFDILLGSRRYFGRKVPMEAGGDDSHWRESVFDNELMTPRDEGEAEKLSIVTVGALADIGYEITFLEADEYSLPPVRRAKPVSETTQWCRVLEPPGGPR